MFVRLLGAGMLALTCSVANAQDYSVGELQIAHPWSRAMPPNAATGAAYFVVHNNGSREDRLLAVSTPQASKAEMHTMVQIGEMMKMQALDSVGIPPGGDAKFAPGGSHVMLFGLRKPLVAGERFPLTLQFEKAGKVDVEVVVEATAPDGHADH